MLVYGHLSSQKEPPITYQTWSQIKASLGINVLSSVAHKLSEPTQLNLQIYILYFDQSSYALRPGVKNQLDSIARQLVEQPNLLATLTGYTDNVGSRELNWQLAERRTKTVESYLKQRSVRANQIKVNWEGPDTKDAVGNPGTVKTISRRVILQLSPR
ncbi:hypothetical protein GCM10028807_51440 [Spirosoma daeguense]